MYLYQHLCGHTLFRYLKIMHSSLFADFESFHNTSSMPIPILSQVRERRPFYTTNALSRVIPDSTLYLILIPFHFFPWALAALLAFLTGSSMDRVLSDNSCQRDTQSRNATWSDYSIVWKVLRIISPLVPLYNLIENFVIRTNLIISGCCPWHS